MAKFHMPTFESFRNKKDSKGIYVNRFHVDTKNHGTVTINVKRENNSATIDYASGKIVVAKRVTIGELYNDIRHYVNKL